MAASYPTSVKTFTAKNTGDTIEATHVTDLQDEVTAIEDGLRNAKAPLNSSNSTVANLSVTGASTLATLSVTGGSTFVGTVTFAGAWTIGPATLGGGGTPTLSSGNTNDLVVSSNQGHLELNGNSSGSSLTGIAMAGGARDGQTLAIFNIGSANIVLKGNTGSASSNQFAVSGGSALTLTPGGGVWAVYVATYAQWRVMTP